MSTTLKIKDQRYPDLVQNLINMVRAFPYLKTESLDRMGKPVIEILIEEGVITAESHIEWAGVAEHKVIPIFWYDADTGDHCLNVNADGSIDTFK